MKKDRWDLIKNGVSSNYREAVEFYCYDAGIPLFLSIDIQYISFLSPSGLRLHNQFCRFFALIKIAVFDQQQLASEA